MQPEIYIPIISVVVLAVIVFIVRKKTTPSEEDKKEVEDFLNSIADDCTELILKTIDDIADAAETGDIKSLDVFISDSLGFIEVSVTDALTVIAEKHKNDNTLSKIAYRLLTKKDFLDKFIVNIIKDIGVEDKLTEVWEENFSERLEKAEKVDEELEGKYDNEEEYFEKEESKPEDLEAAITPEERAKEENKKVELNPPKDTDEEEAYTKCEIW